MKYIISSILLSLLLMTACEDVIDIDTADVSDVLTVDAWLTTESEAQTIRLFGSPGFLTSGTIPTIDDADIEVTNKTKNSTYTFSHDTDGAYTWIPSGTETLGEVGDEFSISIAVDGETYIGDSYVGRVPVIDSIAQKFEGEDLREDGIYLTLFSRDVKGLGDAYWIKTYKNGNYLDAPNELNIAFDGSVIQSAQADTVIFIPPVQQLLQEKDGDGADIPWKVGEEVRIEIHSITVDAFEFLRIARDQMLNSDNGIFSSPLANARGNVRNQQSGQLIQGVFNVSAVVAAEKTIE